MSTESVGNCLSHVDLLLFLTVHTELAKLACGDTVISDYSNYCAVSTVFCSITNNTQAESVFTVFTVIIVQIQYSQYFLGGKALVLG